MARERAGPLLAQLARLARLAELSSEAEEECLRLARGFETCRRSCGRLGLDLRRARERLVAAEGECSALRVKLKHARNQVEVEMGKRHRAEAELEKQVIRPESCTVCGSRARFGRVALRCRHCHLLVHSECRGRCPAPCTPGPRPPQGLLADFAPPAPPLVPALVVHCVSEVERRGLTETGLYRVPGAEPLVREWKQRLLQARGALPGLGRVPDVHVVCGVLKDFLRGLKEPLVTFQLHPVFLRAADVPDEAALCHVVSRLPPANRATLAFLMLHLLRVAQSPECRMDKPNLARVFGPTLVGHGTSSPTPLAILEDTPQQCKVMARLLALPPEVWTRFVGPETLVPAAASDPLALNKRERLFHPLSSPEMNSTQLSPAGCCLPDPLRSRAPLPAPGSRKTGRFFPSLL